ncbi:MAG: VOC family protein [Oscillospiraceae bacterium]|nr:VOC family protein [Oscillospiraceae bacterium]
MKVAPQIYIKDSAEAAAFYQKAFGLTIGMTDMNDDGTYKHVSLMFGKTEILAIGENSDNISYYSNVSNEEPISINLWELATNEAVDHAFTVLREGAYRIDNKPDSPEWDNDFEHYGFSVLDKYGVNWWICR